MDVTGGITSELTVTSITGGITCKSNVRDITNRISGELTVIATVMDITGSITCELTVILQRKCINVDFIYRPRYYTYKYKALQGKLENSI